MKMRSRCKYGEILEGCRCEAACAKSTGSDTDASFAAIVCVELQYIQNCLHQR